MATTTSNLTLRKETTTETYNVDTTLNNNWDKIDAALSASTQAAAGSLVALLRETAVTPNYTGSTAAKTVNLTPTWNSSGALYGYYLDVTHTTAGATSRAVSINRGGNPIFEVDLTTNTAATGLKVTGHAAASRAFLSVLSTGTDEGLSVDAKGSGTIRLGATSTGAVEFSRNAVPTANDGAALGTAALGWADLHIAAQGVINWANGEMTITETDANTLTVAGGTFATAALTATTIVASSTLQAAGITNSSTLTQNGVATVTSTTSNQLNVKYDGSNHLAIDVSSAGAVTYNATGASAGHTFSDLVTANAGLTVPSGQTVTLAGIAYTFPANNGDASQYLQTDGNGTLTWAAGSATVAGSDLTGTVLATAIVTFGAAANDTVWTGQSWSLTGANSTDNSVLTLTNSSNAAAASHSYLDVAVGGTTSTGDPHLRLTIPGGTSWYLGADNSASDALVEGIGTAVGTTASRIVTVAGEQTMPLQPAFLAYNSATDTNQTGAGTTVTVDFDTEVFDQGGDFATDTFTAPVTGKYLLSTSVFYLDASTAMVGPNLTIVTSNRTYTAAPTFAAATGGPQWSISMTATVDMDAGDTAIVRLSIGGGAGDTADIYGTSAPYTFFSGHLAC